MNIRKHLVVWHTIILAGFLLVFIMGLFMAFKYHLYAEVDGSLESWASHSNEFIDREISPDNQHNPSSSSRSSFHANLLDSFSLVIPLDKKIDSEYPILSKRSLSQLQNFLKFHSPITGDSYATISLNSQPYRIYYKPIRNQKILVLGRSLMHVKETLSELTVTLSITWIIAVIACAIISWAFVGRTLNPVKTMTKDALNIAISGELSRRINSFSEKDEFGELSSALNRMLLSLEMSYTAQKKFLADASHELRTPLTSIRTNLEFMKRAVKARENERLAALEDTISEANRMTRLVNELLMLTRAEAAGSLILEKLDFCQVVHEVSQSYQLRQEILHKTIVLETPGPIWINGDSGRLHEVIVILLDNAIKYSPEGGQIHIKAFQQGKLAWLEMSDDGPGIPENEIELVFNRFYRATNVRSQVTGTGLGLAIVKSILRYHGGNISLSNKKPRGLSVSVTIPVVNR